MLLFTGLFMKRCIYITSQIRRRNTQNYFISSPEDNTFASDENILGISKRLIRQNKETYEVLANQVNPRQDQVDIAKSLFGILPKDADVEESRAERMKT